MSRHQCPSGPYRPRCRAAKRGQEELRGSFLFLLFFLFLLEPEEEEARSSDRSADASDSILLNSASERRQAGTANRVSISLTSACRLCRLIRSFSFAAISTSAFLFSSRTAHVRKAEGGVVDHLTRLSSQYGQAHFRVGVSPAARALQWRSLLCP